MDTKLLNENEKILLKYLIKCKEIEGNPIKRSVAKLQKEMPFEFSTTKKAIKVLTVGGFITRDISDPINPKIFVN